MHSEAAFATINFMLTLKSLYNCLICVTNVPQKISETVESFPIFSLVQNNRPENFSKREIFGAFLHYSFDFTRVNLS